MWVRMRTSQPVYSSQGVEWESWKRQIFAETEAGSGKTEAGSASILTIHVKRQNLNVVQLLKKHRLRRKE